MILSQHESSEILRTSLQIRLKYKHLPPPLPPAVFIRHQKSLNLLQRNEPKMPKLNDKRYVDTACSERDLVERSTLKFAEN
ncbi:hypothetical protein P5673_027578 [Acropora cervicornis]|uniref:Uncharacterized protein n=1 Tax=Acropora cervicornis TaxID=6130 RepID=A0AAD9UVV3_ACRCE|nr:hypothetical protein P5673_027578 [Acropora cervicornis]